MDTSTETKVWWDLAILLHRQCRYADALDCMLAVERRAPDYPGLPAALGVICRDSGDLVRAERYLRQACAAQPHDPAAHFNLAVTLLRAGRLQEGFHEYEWRWRVAQFAGQRREFPQPMWRGEPLQGRRILLYSEQGAGDAIQFVRYAELVRKAGGKVLIEALPHLERLLTWMDSEVRIVNATLHDVDFDVQSPLMSLPLCFGTDLDSIPAPARFSLPLALTAKWARRLRTGRMSVGVVWAANPAYYNNAARSIPAQLLAPLTRIPGGQFWSLQVGPAAADIPEGMVSLSQELTNFAETAAAICALDLVITVDTAVAHLAGSLGKPVWLLLCYASDWRWMLDREDSPWYPTMRIFRQQQPDEWGELMDRVASAVPGFAAGYDAGSDQ